MHASSDPVHYPDDNVIDFRQLASRLWRRRRLILAGTTTAVVLALAASVLLMKYESTGVFRIDSLGLADYRRLKTILIDQHRFDRFAKATGVTDTPARDFLIGYLTNDKAFGQLVSPAYSLTKDDLKQVANAKTAEKSPFIGLRITIRAREAETSLTATKLLSDYLLDTAMLSELTDWVRSNAFSNKNEKRQLENEVIQNRFDIQQSRSKLALLKELLVRYPDAAKEGTRQLFSLEKGGDRYLTPLAQVVARESIIADLELAQADYERRNKQNQIRSQFFNAALVEVEKATTGQNLLNAFPPLLEHTLSKYGPDNDAITLEENRLALDLNKLHNRYNEEFRFLVPPELPEKRKGKSPLLVTAFSGIVGLVLMALCALLLDWWRENRDSITADDPSSNGGD